MKKRNRNKLRRRFPMYINEENRENTNRIIDWFEDHGYNVSDLAVEGLTKIFLEKRTEHLDREKSPKDLIVEIPKITEYDEMKINGISLFNAYFGGKISFDQLGHIFRTKSVLENEFEEMPDYVKDPLFLYNRYYHDYAKRYRISRDR